MNLEGFKNFNLVLGYYFGNKIELENVTLTIQIDVREDDSNESWQTFANEERPVVDIDYDSLGLEKYQWLVSPKVAAKLEELCLARPLLFSYWSDGSKYDYTGCYFRALSECGKLVERDEDTVEVFMKTVEYIREDVEYLIEEYYKEDISADSPIYLKSMKCHIHAPFLGYSWTYSLEKGWVLDKDR